MWRLWHTVMTGGMVLLALAVLSVPANALPESEYLKIVALLEHVGHLTDAVFLSPEKAYTAKAAARFLRQQWEAKADDIRTSGGIFEQKVTVLNWRPFLAL
jgi:hypothetical protein